MFNKILIGVVASILPTSTVMAKCDKGSAGDGFGTICNPVAKDITSIGSLFEVILKGITYIAIPVIVLALIWVGFKFVAAQGEAGKISEAKKSLLGVLAGAVVVLGANVILAVVTDTAKELITP